MIITVKGWDPRQSQQREKVLRCPHLHMKMITPISESCPKGKMRYLRACTSLYKYSQLPDFLTVKPKNVPYTEIKRAGAMRRVTKGN